MVRAMMSQKAKLKNGIYILRTDNKLYTREQWNTAWNRESVGVAIVTDKCKFIISKQDAYSGSYHLFSSDATDFPIVPDGTQDYNGAENTSILLRYSTQYDAAYKCSYTQGQFPDARMPYIPALGEFLEALKNKSEVNACLTACGASLLNLGGYWTSTLTNPKTAYILNWNTGAIVTGDRSSSTLARSFAALN